MTQALHMFRKDVRCFRYELGVVGALTATFAWSHIAADAPHGPELSRATILAYLTSVLLVSGWWFLVAQLIHEEALVGDRQFWITRPYSWKDLLGAKVLFVLAFVNAPLLVAQMVILGATGFSPLGGFPRLLWMQLAAALVLLAPAFALATMTRSLAQIVLFLLCVAAGLYFAVAGRSSGGSVSLVVLQFSWTNAAAAVVVLCAGAALVVRWQYSMRRTRASIFAGLSAIVFAVAVSILFPVTFRYTLQSWMFRRPEARTVSVALGQPFARGSGAGEPWLRMEIPFTFSEAVVPDAIAVSIEAPGNVRWSQGWMGGYPIDSTMSYRHVLFFERDFYRRVASRTVTLRASMYLRLQNQTRLPLPAGRATRIPGGAFCAISTVDKADVVFCRSPFRSLYDAVRGSDAATHELLSIWYSPWPAEFALSPVFTDSFSCAAGSTVSFVREDPLGWVRRDLRATVQLPPLPPEVQP